MEMATILGLILVEYYSIHLISIYSRGTVFLFYLFGLHVNIV